jgi:hypothetical protein
MTDRKKPGVAFWAIVALVAVLVAYPLSLGPACWLADKGVVSVIEIKRTYRPLVAWMLSPTLPFSGLVLRYALRCGEKTAILLIEMDSTS